MRWERLLSRTERTLFIPIYQSIFGWMVMYLTLEMAIFFACAFYFWDTIPISINLIFVISLIIFGIPPLTQTWYWRFRKKWDEQNPPYAIALWTLMHALSGYLWWGGYLFVLIYHNPDSIPFLLVLLGVISAFAISLLGVFIKIHIISITALLLAQFIFLTHHYPHEPQHLLQALLLALFQYLMVIIQNHKILNAIGNKQENQKLLHSLWQKNHELGEANLAQARHLSAASHDLRQPIHALALILNDIQRRNQQKKLQRTVLSMENAVIKLNQSFDAMLNLSRLDAGIIQAHILAMRLDPLFERLAQEFTPMTNAKGIALHIVHCKSYVYSDEKIVHTILSQFLNNAIRYTNKGKVLMGARHHKTHIDILIHDTGIGIPESKLHNIFEQYHQLESADQRATGGVGLGLAIAGRMARLLDAKLMVHSIPNKGSIFGIQLPRAPSKPITPPPSPPMWQNPLHSKSIALINDDEASASELIQLFESWGMLPSTILSGEMLRESLEEGEHYDFVIAARYLPSTQESGIDILNSMSNTNVPPPHLLLLNTREDSDNNINPLGIHVLPHPLGSSRLRTLLAMLSQK